MECRSPTFILYGTKIKEKYKKRKTGNQKTSTLQRSTYDYMEFIRALWIATYFYEHPTLSKYKELQG